MSITESGRASSPGAKRFTKVITKHTESATNLQKPVAKLTKTSSKTSYVAGKSSAENASEKRRASIVIPKPKAPPPPPPTKAEKEATIRDVEKLQQSIDRQNVARDRANSALRKQVDTINKERRDAYNKQRSNNNSLAHDPDFKPPKKLDADTVIALASGTQSRSKLGKVGSVILPNGWKLPIPKFPLDAAYAESIEKKTKPGAKTDPNKDLAEYLKGYSLTPEQVNSTLVAYSNSKTATDELTKAETQLQGVARAHPEYAEILGKKHLQATVDYFARHGIKSDPVKIETWLKAGWSNAHFVPSEDMIAFGDINGVPLAYTQDVVAHEYTHRIVHELIPNYGRDGETGAINESLADTIGAAIDGDWHMAEDVGRTGGIRVLNTPSATISTYERGDEVHHGAAIANNAASQIGNAIGTDKMGDIYVEAMKKYVPGNVTFTKLATDTWNASVDLYGENSKETNAVEQAWDSVLELHGKQDLFHEIDPREGYKETPPQKPVVREGGGRSW